MRIRFSDQTVTQIETLNRADGFDEAFSFLEPLHFGFGIYFDQFEQRFEWDDRNATMAEANVNFFAKDCLGLGASATFNRLDFWVRHLQRKLFTREFFES